MRKAISLGSTRAAPVSSVSWLWMGVALLAHTAWGAYPVLARYLQTVSNLPSMSLLALGNLLALLIYAPFALRRVKLAHLRSPLLWAFGFVVVLRAVTNLLAARYTPALYVQLITLMTPLLVAILSAGLFREKLPPFTLPAIGLSLGGALLMLSAQTGAGGITLALSGTEWLGVIMAMLSACCLAVYMLLVPRTIKDAVPGEVVLLMQLVVLTLSTALFSALLGEDWGRYTAIGANDWLVFGLFVVVALLGANLGQIASLRHLGAPLVSSSMAWRLLSTLGIGMLLLGERLSSIWQVLGMCVVLATITLYLWRQRRA